MGDGNDEDGHYITGEVDVGGTGSTIPVVAGNPGDGVGPTTGGVENVDPLAFAPRCTLQVRSRFLDLYLVLAQASYSRARELQNSNDGRTQRDYDFVLSMRYSALEEAWHRSAQTEFVRSTPFAVCDGEGIYDDILDLDPRSKRGASRRSGESRSWTWTCS